MMTLRLWSRTPPQALPYVTACYLADIGEAKGRQELFTRQSPQRLKALREHAVIESAVSSNRIEGVVVEADRVGALMAAKPRYRDRDEEEVHGYQQALRWIHEKGAVIPVTEETVLRLHRTIRGEIADAGRYKKRDGDIIETYADGRSRVRFRTVSARQTPQALAETLDLWRTCLAEQWMFPLLALGAFNLDFLCVHPFRDGNGRVSRLLLLLQCYHLGLEAGRYISLERLIEQNKERYYETLEESSRGWHEGKHNPWPYVNYILYIVKSAYREMGERLESISPPRGAKTESVQSAIHARKEPFTLAEIERACPGVSRDMVRRILRDLRRRGEVECLGRGPGAKWVRRGNTPKRG